MIPKETQVQLRRLSELSAVMDRDLEQTDSVVFDEYHTILQEVTPVLMPVMELIRKAGVLVMDMHVCEHVRAEIARPEVEQLWFECDGLLATKHIHMMSGGLITSYPPKPKRKRRKRKAHRDVSIEVPDLEDNEVIRVIPCVEIKTGRRVQVAVIVATTPTNPDNPGVTPLAILLGKEDDFFRRFVPAPTPEEN